MGDTSNWEFAAAVGAVTIGLGGLLLLTLVGAFGSWRLFDRTARLAGDSQRAHEALEELAEQLRARLREEPAPSSRVEELAALRRQSEQLLEQQSRIEEALRALRPPAGDAVRADELREVETMLRRLEQTMNEMAAALANLAAHQR